MHANYYDYCDDEASAQAYAYFDSEAEYRRDLADLEQKLKGYCAERDEWRKRLNATIKRYKSLCALDSRDILDLADDFDLENDIWEC